MVDTDDDSTVLPPAQATNVLKAMIRLSTRLRTVLFFFIGTSRIIDTRLSVLMLILSWSDRQCKVYKNGKCVLYEAELMPIWGGTGAHRWARYLPVG